MGLPILAVIGATGNQGGSVVDYVLNDPTLSQKFRIRGLTRDPSKPAAQALRGKGVEIMRADLTDVGSLQAAFHEVHSVFGFTGQIVEASASGQTDEFQQGKALADAAVAAGVQYLIWSTLPSASQISGGKFQHVKHFDAKAEVERYIRSLPIKSAFFAPASFMQNFMGAMAPHPVGDGTYAISNVVRPDTPFPLIDVVSDTGKFVGVILADPDQYAGKVLSGAVGLYSVAEIAKIISTVTGKAVEYVQIPDDVFRGFLPQQAAAAVSEMMLFIDEFGYYGPKQSELISWSTGQVRGQLTTLEEFLKKFPLNL
ncbi:hypothetical protein B0O99DRAFT_693059 [Bisporella sp. PMI_857]|nr:hypothetical protein B0O99DRAFT_693059 [Bisporella sp. PMI_857]